jgi:hypothetical protein
MEINSNILTLLGTLQAKIEKIETNVVTSSRKISKISSKVLDEQ